MTSYNFWQKWLLFFGLYLVVWFVIDTVISVYYRVGFNVFINITFLLFALLPLISTRKYFRRP